MDTFESICMQGRGFMAFLCGALDLPF
jgi:hypothetical protein